MADNNGNGWKPLIIENAVKQGPSFIVLCLILWGLWSLGNYGIKTAESAIPQHLQQIQTGYEKIQSAFDSNIKTIQASNDRNIERMIESSEKERILLRESIGEFREAVKELKVKTIQPPSVNSNGL